MESRDHGGNALLMCDSITDLHMISTGLGSIPRRIAIVNGSNKQLLTDLTQHKSFLFVKSIQSPIMLLLYDIKRQLVVFKNRLLLFDYVKSLKKMMQEGK